MNKVLFRAMRLVLGSIVMLFAGIIYSWSVLKAPLAYEFGWNSSQLSLNFTLTLCFFCIGGLLGSKLVHCFSVGTSLRVGAVLVAAGFIIVAHLTGSIVPLYVSYAGMAGTGIGLIYNIIVSSTGAWYPDKKGFCAGVLMMCFGFSSLIIGKIADVMFASESLGWRRSYILLGIAIAVAIIAVSFGIKVPSPGTSFPKPVKKVYSRGEDFIIEERNSYQMSRRLSFWKFFIFSILTASVGSCVISFARDLVLSIWDNASFATTLVGVLSMCNGFGRIAGGMIFDLAGRRKTMIISNLITIIAPVVILGSIILGSIALCVVGLCLTGLCYGFSPTISSSFIAAFYGLENFSSNYSLANMMLIPASFSSTIAGIILTRTGSYIAPFVMLVLFAVAALLVNLSIRRP